VDRRSAPKTAVCGARKAKGIPQTVRSSQRTRIFRCERQPTSVLRGCRAGRRAPRILLSGTFPGPLEVSRLPRPPI